MLYKRGNKLYKRRDKNVNGCTNLGMVANNNNRISTLSPGEKEGKMTIDEAIKQLEDHAAPIYPQHPQKLQAALELGIEAMKRCLRLRSDKHCSPIKPLPGETED